jgi:hypothetical protein
MTTPINIFKTLFTLIPPNQISSSFSIPIVLTVGFHICAGNYADAPAGFLTCFRSPMNIFVVLHEGKLAG